LSIFDQSRIGGENTRNIGINLAKVSFEGGGKRDSRRIGAASTQGCNLQIFGAADSLKPGNDDDFALFEVACRLVRL